MGRRREKNQLTHPQAELGLSHMWPERGSNPHDTQRCDDQVIKKQRSKPLGHGGRQLLKLKIRLTVRCSPIPICDLDVKYSGGTTNISSHVKRHHPSALSLIRKLDPEVGFINSNVPTPTPEQTGKTIETRQESASYPFRNVWCPKPYPLNFIRATAITRSIAKYIVQD